MDSRRAIITGAVPISKRPLQAAEPDLEISAPTDEAWDSGSNNRKTYNSLAQPNPGTSYTCIKCCSKA